MKRKLMVSVILVVALTIGGLLAIYLNREVVSLNGVKSAQYLRCEALVNDIQTQENCEHKWTLYLDEFKDCADFKSQEALEGQFEASNFKDIIFEIGQCFVKENKKQQAGQVYKKGLALKDWTLEDHFNSYSAHFLMNRELELLEKSQNPVCYDEKSFEAQVIQFTQTTNAEDFRKLLYSDKVLDTQVMASDAGGYLSFDQWKEVFEENKSQYKLKFLKKVGNKCFVTVGWDQDYPWRAFCADQMTETKCLYLMTIYAGIEATLPDFEEFKKSDAKGD